MKYYRIAVFANLEGTLTYSYNGEIRDLTGLRVSVPLGKKTATGVAVSAIEKPDIPAERIKEINRVLDITPVLTKEMIKLGLWAASYYLSAPGLVFSTILAPLYRVASDRIVKLIAGVPADFEGVAGEIIKYLEARPGKWARYRDMQKHLKARGMKSAVEELAEKGVIVVSEKEKTKGIKNKRARPDNMPDEEAEDLTLNSEQKKAVGEITAAISSGIHRTFLLFGATGSGKTEVYIRAVKEARAKGLDCIVLVPEIFLTPQTVLRFRSVFKEDVAIYHSGLKPAERLHEWERLNNNEAHVAVGTRSAVFAPLKKIGLIVVDEEFDTSYKQENDPKYSARDTAVYRASINSAVAVLGSATPSVESFYNAKSGKYTMLKLSGRVLERPMPQIQVVDLKYDLNKSRDLFFSNEFIRQMRESVEAGEQAVLFINRRGYSGYNFCPECGRIEKCVNCEIPLVYHSHGASLKCHYCGYEKKPSVICPECGKPIFYKGAGTQRVEDVVLKFFPDRRVERVDLDTMDGHDRYIDVYSRIKNREIDILIGTQMVAKGFDFPGVTFVGVVTIDALLNLPDFRSEERVFQLLMQVAGRAGRGDIPGRVVIQTFNPGNPAVAMVREYKTEEFLEAQLRQRRELGYPPYKKMIQAIIQDASFETAVDNALRALETIKQSVKNLKARVDILGPSEAPLSRLRNKYRQSIIIRSADRQALNAVGVELKKLWRFMDISVTVDPVNTL
jgi:primosomal protein N' (replication factor Y)